MNVLIVEDELHATEQLKTCLEKEQLDIQILNTTTSVKETLHWFNNNEEPDLLFLDIQLSDGLCFEILQQKEILCPIIFTTAFDKFAIKAFEVNSLDYILKPYTQEEIHQSIMKLQKLEAYQQKKLDTTLLKTILPSFKNKYKNRFFVKFGSQALSIPTEEIAFFYTEDVATILVSTQGKKYVVNYSLDQLEKVVDPSLFFRITRQFLIHHQAIDAMHCLGKGRIQLTLKHTTLPTAMVSRNRTAGFKEWLGN